MNKERLSIIADWLEAGGDNKDGYGFNMEHWLTEGVTDYTGSKCGTAMCIGGAADTLFGGHMAESLGLGSAYEEGTKADQLCHPRDIGILWYMITPQAAATVVRHLITFGVVDWRLAEDHMGETE